MLLWGVHLLAQDIIYKADGTKIETKILHVGVNTVKYKEYSNLNGHAYVISKKEISVIEYQNGEYLVVDGKTIAKKKEVAPADSMWLDFGRNLSGINLFDIFFTTASFSYERLFTRKGIMGIRMPVSIGIGENNHTERGWKRYSFGLDYNFYFKRQSKGGPNFFCSLSVRTGTVELIHYEEYHWSFQVEDPIETHTATFTGTGRNYLDGEFNFVDVYYFNGGMLARLNKHIDLSIRTGVFKRFIGEHIQYEHEEIPKLDMEFNVYYRF